jgi:DNA-binding PadR family transcriptional regulator
MTGPEMAILSLIAEKPRHGYEIEQLIAQRGLREWIDISYTTIYYQLKRLEKKNLATSKLRRKAGMPSRRVFTITDHGKEQLAMKAYRLFQVPAGSYSSLPLGISMLPMLDFPAVIKRSRHYLTNLIKREKALTAKRNALKPPPHIFLMFDYQLAMIAAEIDWVSNFIQSYDDAVNNSSGTEPEQIAKSIGE